MYFPIYFLAYHNPAKNVSAILCSNPTRLVVYQFNPTFDRIKLGDFQPLSMSCTSEFNKGRQIFVDYFKEDYDDNCLGLTHSPTATTKHYMNYFFCRA